MGRFIESMGQFTGETFAAPMLERMRKKIEHFKLELSGEEKLKAMKDKQFIMVANHLMPKGGIAQQSQLSPDAFVLERLANDANGQELKIVAKCDDGWQAENLYRHFQKHIGQPFGQGLAKGLGFIPIKKNPGSFNRDFMKTVDGIVKEGTHPILMFPEGTWHEDFDPESKLEPGAAHISRKYGLPVLPVYIKGAHSWEPDTEVQVAIGDAFEPGELSKEEITEQIRQNLATLQESVSEENK